MPALQRIPDRWQVIWGIPPESVTPTSVWTLLSVAGYRLEMGASFVSHDSFPRPRPAGGRLTIISRNGRYSPWAGDRPAGSPDVELLQRRSAVRWQWQDPTDGAWRNRWTGALTDLDDAGNDEVSARLQSPLTEEMAARTTIEAGDTTGSALLRQFGVVSAIAPPQDTLLTMPGFQRRTLTIVSDLAEVMSSWPMETHAGQICYFAPADVTIARMNDAPLLDLQNRLTGAYQIEHCDTMRQSRVRYPFGSPSGSQLFDTLMMTAGINLATGENLILDVDAPTAGENYLWKINYSVGDFTDPEAQIANELEPEDATPVPGYGAPPVAIDSAGNPTLRSVPAFLTLIGFVTPGTAKTATIVDGLITVTAAIPTAAVLAADLRVTVAPRPDSQSARVVVSNVATEAGRQWLHWSGAWRDVSARIGMRTNSDYFVAFSNADARALASADFIRVSGNLQGEYPGALSITFIRYEYARESTDFRLRLARWIATVYFSSFTRTEPWVVDRIAPPTYRYRASLDILANRQTAPGRGGNYIYASNPALIVDDDTASPQEWWRTNDVEAAQRLADTLAVPRTFLRCTLLDWPAAGDAPAHTFTPCQIYRVTFQDFTRNISIEEPYAVIGMQHHGESGRPGQTTLRLLSLRRPPEAPTGVTVQRSGQTLLVRWTEELAIWGSESTGTDVQYRLRTVTTWTSAIDVAPNTYEVTLPVPPGAAFHEVRLRSTSTAGIGHWSDPVTES